MKLFPKGKSFYCFTLPTRLRKYETRNQSQNKSFTKFAKDRYEFLFRKYIHEQTVLLIVSKYGYWGLGEILSTGARVLLWKKKKRNTCLKVCIIWFLAMRRELCAIQVAVSSLSPVNIHIWKLENSPCKGFQRQCVCSLNNLAMSHPDSGISKHFKRRTNINL